MNKTNFSFYRKYLKPNLNLLLKISGISFLAASQTFIASSASAGTPLTTKETFSGKVNYTVTGGTLRSSPDLVDACSLNSSSTAQLSSIPSNATVKKAYLYWGGSGSTVDSQVTLDSTSVSADQTYTDDYSIPKWTKNSKGKWVTNSNYDLDFFQGVKDVTSLVANKGNGNYQFQDLSVTNSGDQCALKGTLSAWSLVVIYEDPAIPNDKLNTIELYEGLEASRNQSVDYTLNGIQVSSNPVAKFSMLLWEGDESLGGENEYFSLNNEILIDNFNLVNNQFNSSINTLQLSNTYGVDLDTFDVSSYVNEGDTSITGTISTNNDLVIQGAALVMVTDQLAVQTNDTPSAQPDTITTDEDTVGTYNLIAGDPNNNNDGQDTDPNGDSLTLTKFVIGSNEYAFNDQVTRHQVTMPSGAILTVESNGNVSYDPNGQFESFTVNDSLETQDEFTYTVSDDSGATSSAKATLDINGVADNPIAEDDTATTDENTIVKIDVLNNDRDPDSANSALRVTKINNIPLVSGTPVLLNESTGASVYLNPDGTLNYDPTNSLSLNSLNQGEEEEDTFTYTVQDEVGNTDTGSVTTTVTGITDSFAD